MYKAFFLFCFRNKYKLLIFGLLLMIAVVFLLRLGTFPSDDPRDSELVASFREHRRAFETLCAMALEDSGTVSFISLKTLREEDNLESRRRAKYEVLLNEIKLVTDISINDQGRVMFEYRAGGELASGPNWHKGIAYFPGGVPEEDAAVVDDLDHLGDRPGRYLKPLEKNWYLIYQNFGNE